MELTESRLKESSLHINKYKNKLSDYAESFPYLLDDFKNSYISFNKNPEVEEYGAIYSSSKSNIQKANTDVFVTTNDIQTKIDELNAFIASIGIEIDKEKIKNADLKNKLGMLNSENNTTGIMIDNYKETYNTQYFINFVIFLGILFICFFMYKMSKMAPIPEIVNP